MGFETACLGLGQEDVVLVVSVHGALELDAKVQPGLFVRKGVQDGGLVGIDVVRLSAVVPAPFATAVAPGHLFVFMSLLADEALL